MSDMMDWMRRMLSGMQDDDQVVDDLATLLAAPPPIYIARLGRCASRDEIYRCLYLVWDVNKHLGRLPSDSTIEELVQTVFEDPFSVDIVLGLPISVEKAFENIREYSGDGT